MPTIVNLTNQVKHLYFRKTLNDEFKMVKTAYEKDSGAIVFSASQPITYIVDIGTTYTEEIEYGASALAPTSFTPTKSGYTFVGWRSDDTASASVLDEKIVDTEAFTLYAVFKKTVTLSFTGNGSTSGSTSSKTGTIYYNNEDVLGATITLPSSGFKRTNYTFSRWSEGSTSGTKYDANDEITITANTTMYAMWKATSYTTSQFTIHGYGNAEWTNAVNSESKLKTLISSIDLTGFSEITLKINNFHSSDGIENANSKGARVRIKLSGTTIIELTTHSENKTTGSGSYDCSNITGAKSVQYCYYNMDGNCEADECTLTFTSSGVEV